MKDVQRLLRELDESFSVFNKPPKLYATTQDTQTSPRKRGEYSKIQRDFENVSRNEMSYQHCSMMILDGPLISDEAICYYLPRLSRAALCEGGDEYVLYKRLELLDQTKLNQNQRTLLAALIRTLKEAEKRAEREEEEEIEGAWEDWLRERAAGSSIGDKLLLASATGDIKSVTDLLRRGADPNSKDPHGNSAVSIARMKGRDQVVDILKKAGASDD